MEQFVAILQTRPILVKHLIGQNTMSLRVHSGRDGEKIGKRFGREHIHKEIRTYSSFCDILQDRIQPSFQVIIPESIESKDHYYWMGWDSLSKPRNARKSSQ